MALYQIIQELEHLDYFPDLVNKGIIPSTFVDYKVIYEYYLGLINGHYDGAREERASKRLAKQNTAAEFNLSEVQVYKIVQRMEN